jgi:hypothetical protein
MPPVGFAPTIAAGERPWTYALDRAATGTSQHVGLLYKYQTKTLQTSTVSFARDFKWFCTDKPKLQYFCVINVVVVSNPITGLDRP